MNSDRAESQRRAAARIAGALGIWLALGFSLGWYYTFTYYGRAGWPMPMAEPCLSLLLYYFSVLNVPTPGQAVHWMLVFPAAGVLWAAALHAVGRRRGLDPPPFSRALAWLAVASIPLALPGPWMAWLAGQTDAGFDWDRMIAVALRRGHTGPWPWLSPMYFGLGLLGLAIQCWAYRRLWRPAAAYPALVHAGLSAIAAILAGSILAALAALPLRLWLE